MKKLILAIVIILTSCQKKESKPFDDFVFSSAGLHHDFSLKFSNSDTVFFQKRFPEPVQNYYAILGKKDNETIDSLFEKLNFEKYDTIYTQENLQDGGSLLFNVANKNKKHWVFIYGHEGPKELFNFSIWLRDFKEKQKFKTTTKVSDYGDLKYILPPPPPPKVDSTIPR